MNQIRYTLPSLEDRDERRKRDIDRIMHNPFIRTFLDQNGLSVKDVDDNLLEFLKVDEDSYVCSPCTSLETCPKFARGTRLYLTRDEYGTIEATHAPCEKMMAFKEVADQYIYRDFENTAVYLRPDQIDLSSVYARTVFMKMNERCQPDKHGRGILLFGPSGVGKTHMMIAYANYLALQGKTVAFIQVKRLIEKMERWSKERDDVSTAETLHDLAQVDFLFLDDLGREKVTAFTRDSILLEIIERRLQNGKMNVFATSLRTPEQLKKDYDPFKDGRHERFIGRLLEVSEPLEYPGLSKR